MPPAPFADLAVNLERAASDGHLLVASADNAIGLLTRSSDPLVAASLHELVDAGAWQEIDNRFFRTLVFGTGGLRSKTIGDIVTAAEQGRGGPHGSPEHPCVGTNAMNFFNVSRATQGLVAYVLAHHRREQRTGRPGICIAYDTRFFSRAFAEFAARVITESGCDAHVFEAARSTPELSFAVRHTGSTAGINLTASHNPPEYNGYKVYFEDGGQIVEPHAGGIIACVNAVESDTVPELSADQRGEMFPLGAAMDQAYLDQLATLVLDPAVVRDHPVRIVYSALHGVGGATIPAILERLHLPLSVVASQAAPDGRFPTVTSPNPENAEALSLAMGQASREDADLVLATDPDGDRLGAAARNLSGELQLLTGNQLGSLMAWYRAMKFLELGRLDATNPGRGVIVKTFVTTGLQAAIAAKFGLRCVQTLTGFKYIGAKLAKYEAERSTLGPDQATVFVFGGEESYGYSGADFVRDKDGNGAAVMLAEVACYARSLGLTLHGLLDQIFTEFGYYEERGESFVMDGAEGAAQIQQLVASYATEPPAEFGGHRVVDFRNFADGDLTDEEGDTIPREAMLMLELEQGFRVAVRPSGTEPKIKYYLFGHRTPDADLAAAKRDVTAALDALWIAIQTDAHERLANFRQPD